MQEEQEIELINYLNVIWKRKGLIICGTLVATAMVLVVSLSMPKIYEVSRTLKIGKLPIRGSEKFYIIDRSNRVVLSPVVVMDIEDRESVIARLKDHRVLKAATEKLHLRSATAELGSSVSIDSRSNPVVRYTIQAHNAEDAKRIADMLADYVIKTHETIFERGMQIAREYEAELAARVYSIETEKHRLRKILEENVRAANVDLTAVALLQANVGERERNLSDLRRELMETRLSRLASQNTSVIAADGFPQQPVKPRVKLNMMLASTLGLMGFTFLAFFLEYIEKARSER